MKTGWHGMIVMKIIAVNGNQLTKNTLFAWWKRDDMER